MAQHRRDDRLLNWLGVYFTRHLEYGVGLIATTCLLPADGVSATFDFVKKKF